MLPFAQTCQNEPEISLPTAEYGGDELLMQMLFLAQWAETAELRQEARTWLWICCPDLAEEWGVPQQEVGD